MQLDRIAVVLRPRGPHESTDLALAMLQAWAGPLLAAWLFLVVPVCAFVLGFVESLPLALVLLGFLRPVFELVPQYVVSRALFGSVPRLQEVLTELPVLLLKQAPLALGVHRFVPWRSAIQPVALLERERGARRKRREADIAAQARGPAWFAAATCLALELLLWAQLVLAAYFFTPSELLPDFEFEQGLSGLIDSLGGFDWVLRGTWLASYTLLGILNALCGFALYIDRRTLLEGWDIELVFRSLARRAAKLAQRVLPLLLVASALLGGAREAQGRAQDSAPEPVQVEQPADAAHDPVKVAREVLATDEFDTKETQRVLWPDMDSDPNPRLNLGWIGALVQALMIGALIVLLAVLVLVLARTFGWIQWRKRRAEAAAEPVTHVFGLDVRPQSLPDDVGARARELWLAGQTTEAMGLLYRAALSRLIAGTGLEVEPGDTERDCVERVRRKGVLATAEFFERVTRAWLVCAYSRARPGDEVALELCDRWNGVFEERAA